jgi:hypothetical protein
MTDDEVVTLAADVIKNADAPSPPGTPVGDVVRLRRIHDALRAKLQGLGGRSA